MFKIFKFISNTAPALYNWFLYTAFQILSAYKCLWSFRLHLSFGNSKAPPVCQWHLLNYYTFPFVCMTLFQLKWPSMRAGTVSFHFCVSYASHQYLVYARCSKMFLEWMNVHIGTVIIIGSWTFVTCLRYKAPGYTHFPFSCL